jgi:hypothetical protein
MEEATVGGNGSCDLLLLLLLLLPRRQRAEAPE